MWKISRFMTRHNYFMKINVCTYFAALPLPSPTLQQILQSQRWRRVPRRQRRLYVLRVSLPSLHQHRETGPRIQHMWQVSGSQVLVILLYLYRCHISYVIDVVVLLSFNITGNNISVIYMAAHRCTVGLKKLDLRLGFQRYRHFVGFFNMPVQATTMGPPFLWLFWETAPFQSPFTTRMGIPRTYSHLKHPGGAYFLCWTLLKCSSQFLVNHSQQVALQLSKSHAHWLIHQMRLSECYCVNFEFITFLERILERVIVWSIVNVRNECLILWVHGGMHLSTEQTNHPWTAWHRASILNMYTVDAFISPLPACRGDS